MRLFIAREMLDPHLKIAGAIFNSQLPVSQKLRAATKAAAFYAIWYPKQFLPREWFAVQGSEFRVHLHYAARISRKLARAIFHAMVKFGPKLEREQLLLGRFVDIGTEIFAITATCLRAEKLLNEKYDGEVLRLANFFCESARLRIENCFRQLKKNADHAGYKVAQEALGGKYSDVEQGIVSRKQM